MKKTAKLLSILVVALLALTACSSSKNDALTIAADTDPVTFDIQDTNDTATTRVAKNIFETLIRQDEELNLVPALAKSWEAVDDTTYEFKLKEGVKWHNGDDFTANDVAYTLTRAKDSGYIAHIVSAISLDKLEVVDEYTIRIGSDEPFGPFLTHLAHPATAIMNEKAVEAAGDDVGTQPVGTGAFKLDSWNVGSDLTLVRNDDYHGEKAASEKIVFKFIGDATVREAALENGEVDIAYAIAPADIKKVEDHPDLTMVRDLDLSTSYVGFNVQSETPVKDKAVRQAINYAINVESILDAVYLGAGKPAAGPLNAQAFGANPNLDKYDYDVEKAKTMLADAGYADGFAVNLYVGDNNPQRIQIAQVVKEELSKLNIDVQIKQMEWGAYLDATAKGEHDMFILGWTTVTTDGDYGLFPLFHSSEFGEAGNRSFYKNDKVDALLSAARFSTDQDARLKDYQEAQIYINDDAPWIFLQDGENLTGISNKVKGFKHHPTATHYLDRVSVGD